ncbi:hypothetical protein H2201_001817 [Coniosporium apollinis]|uniref:FAD dependent oxidoreductase domain-containing protein n=1 Tax=Coniosporium apollinis TaxID=61459 RepID=A0ABQ9P074_9PEZI|nr:hypothetical protein H2201_001817 [Coniosporium apollinis]
MSPPITLPSNIDSSRIIRADYADPAYAALAAEAQEHWRGQWGADGRYHEVGLCLTAEPGKEDYVVKSLENVRALEGLRREAAAAGGRQGGGAAGEGTKIQLLHSPSDIRAALHTGGSIGSSGYLNLSSGWADAEASMRYLRSLVAATKRVTFLTDTVTRLLFSPDTTKVTGAHLASNKTLTADLTILAAGAWSPTLLDLRGIAAARGQCIGYMRVTAEEAARFAKAPVVLDLSSGMYVFPPSADGMVKVAWHSFGWANPVSIPHPERRVSGASGHAEGTGEGGKEERITVSVPRTSHQRPAQQPIPREGQQAIHAFLSQTHPALANRSFARTRLCWYTDTPLGDFLITYHPRYDGLFVATGGSGHGFKFAPVIGDKIVEILLGKSEVMAEGGWGRRWGWPTERLAEGGWTLDGSRGGGKGMVLGEEEGERRAAKL